MKNLFTTIYSLLVMSAQAQFGTCTLVKDINLGLNSSSLPTQKIVYKNKIYFQATNGNLLNGAELWVTDGTTAGTTMVKDIYPGTIGSNPTNFMEYKGLLYFTATTPNEGTEMWRTDGTEAGTVLFKDFYPGSSSGAPTNYVILNGNLIFRVAFDATGNEPWITDGTLIGTQMLKNINQSPAANASSLMGVQVLFNGKAYFSATDTLSGTELWVTDGTVDGTKLVKDINLGKSNSTPLFLTVAGGKLFFRATDSTGGTELWKSDGTAAGTVMVKDIFSGRTAANVLQNSNPTQFTTFGNQLAFTAIDTSGSELWISDGTELGTKQVKNIAAGSASSSPNSLYVFNNKVFFRADNVINGSELWKSDGTEVGTVMVKDIHPTGGSTPQNYAAYGKLLYFNAYDGSNGFEMYETDGTEANTKMTCDFIIGSGGGGPSAMEPMLGALYMSAKNDTSGTELFVFKTALGVNAHEIATKTFTMTAKPTVTTDQTMIEIVSERNATGRLRLSNLLGQAFFDKTIALTQGNQNETISLSNLPNGFYFLTLLIGEEYKTIKIMKE
jgi:trimeric autotransporter adhesin